MIAQHEIAENGLFRLFSTEIRRFWREMVGFRPVGRTMKVQEIREMAARGMPVIQVARELGIHKATVAQIAFRWGIHFRPWGRPDPTVTPLWAAWRVRQTMADLRSYIESHTR